jgi:hypothetical protein
MNARLYIYIYMFSNLHDARHTRQPKITTNGNIFVAYARPLPLILDTKRRVGLRCLNPPPISPIYIGNKPHVGIDKYRNYIQMID